MTPPSFDRKSAMENGWRQCSIFDAKSCPNLYNSLPDKHKVKDAYYMVLSHPCSLLNPNLDSEPNLEYIICERIRNIDGNATYGKNPRLLHIQLDEIEGIILKLEQKNRGFIDKSFITVETPFFSALSIKNESLITRWMANRYISTALPDEFERRITKTKSKLSKTFSNEIGATCKAVYISLNEFIKDLEASENYECLLVFILSQSSYETYVEEEDNDKTSYSDFIKRIVEIFTTVEGVDLKTALFVSEKNFTIEQVESGSLRKWQFDYVSVSKGGETTIIAP
ncbi:hypothetical protein [uncultured Paraglaciecola sp.]|uniref:hypothetical protein n=1 Tax=uncultured Paraglaciecola sp. TaxID=1765024 RepID=UPI002598844C|nr:hypothetical protein [uncultured Paraglaciecola sp.]